MAFARILTTLSIRTVEGRYPAARVVGPRRKTRFPLHLFLVVILMASARLDAEPSEQPPEDDRVAEAMTILRGLPDWPFAGEPRAEVERELPRIEQVCRDVDRFPTPVIRSALERLGWHDELRAVLLARHLFRVPGLVPRTSVPGMELGTPAPPSPRSTASQMDLLWPWAFDEFGHMHCSADPAPGFLMPEAPISRLAQFDSYARIYPRRACPSRLPPPADAPLDPDQVDQAIRIIREMPGWPFTPIRAAGPDLRGIEAACRELERFPTRVIRTALVKLHADDDLCVALITRYLFHVPGLVPRTSAEGRELGWLPRPSPRSTAHEVDLLWPWAFDEFGDLHCSADPAPRYFHSRPPFNLIDRFDHHSRIYRRRPCAAASGN